MGSEITANQRKIAAHVETEGVLDKIILYKNLKPYHIINGEMFQDVNKEGCYKIRVEMGWGNGALYRWNGMCRTEGGTIVDCRTYFRGRSVLAPSKDETYDADNINHIETVFISGHLHLQRTKKYKPEPGEPEDAYHISEIVADSFAIPPCQYGILSWGDGGQLRYTTKEADVERYAAAHGLTDENLLNFKEYGTDFLVGVISQQIYKKMSSLPEEQMRGMAELYGQLNRDYCAGTPIDVKEIKSDEAFRLWERNLPDSRMFEEIDDILRDTRKDHNTWDFPGEW